MARNYKQATRTRQPTVYCSECAHFQRDTEGISFCLDTGEYFMGICTEGLTPDSPKKQFADKPRQCKQYDKSNN